MLSCTKCNQPLRPTAKICIKCGQVVSSESQFPKSSSTHSVINDNPGPSYETAPTNENSSEPIFEKPVVDISPVTSTDLNPLGAIAQTIPIIQPSNLMVGSTSLICQNCKASNPSGTRFCGNCGCSLAVTSEEHNHELPVHKDGGNAVIIGFIPAVLGLLAVIGSSIYWDFTSISLIATVVALGYGVMRKKILIGHTKSIRSSLLTKMNASNQVAASLDKDDQADIAKAYQHPVQSFFANTKNDRVNLQLLAAVAIFGAIVPNMNLSRREANVAAAMVANAKAAADAAAAAIAEDSAAEDAAAEAAATAAVAEVSATAAVAEVAAADEDASHVAEGDASNDALAKAVSAMISPAENISPELSKSDEQNPAIIMAHVKRAAQNRDFETLRYLMTDKFSWTFGDPDNGHKADFAIKAWREDKSYLEEMQSTLSVCYMSGPRKIECPGTGYSYRAYFEYMSTGWRMTGFIAGD